MREYGLVRTNRAIYRIFGVIHPMDQTLGLLRYFRTAGGWQKPPTFAAETISGAALAHYDVPLLFPAQYGIAVGRIPFDGGSSDYRDPIDDDSGLARQVAGEDHLSVGLTGSRLAGTGHAHSDVDLVVFGLDGEQAGQEIVGRHRQLGAPYSSAMEKFLRLADISIAHMGRRNVFKAQCVFEGKLTKVDIHYSPSANVLRNRQVPAGELRAEAIIENLEVLSASGRLFFPGYLLCQHPTYGDVRLWILDHALQFVLPGDILTVRSRVVDSDWGVDLVGVDLVAMRIV